VTYAMKHIHVGERKNRALRRAAPEFADRRDAGERLARFLNLGPARHARVLALPRGGVPVGEPIAEQLQADLDVVLVRKLPVPGSPEQGFGAVTVDGSLTLNGRVVRHFGISPLDIDSIAERVRVEVCRRAKEYRGTEEPPLVRGLDVFLVDDGLATGYTMIAAAKMVRKQEPRSLVLCVPVAPADSLETVASSFDEVYCLLVQETPPFAVASAYRDFHDLSDHEVREVLQRRNSALIARGPG
jgi:putative phosphoribosyl transferase